MDDQELQRKRVKILEFNVEYVPILFELAINFNLEKVKDAFEKFWGLMSSSIDEKYFKKRSRYISLGNNQDFIARFFYMRFDRDDKKKDELKIQNFYKH